jgi:hypothetical protein
MPYYEFQGHHVCNEYMILSEKVSGPYSRQRTSQGFDQGLKWTNVDNILE